MTRHGDDGSLRKMFDISWLEVSLLLAALVVVVCLLWAATVGVSRRLRARRRPHGWDERVLGPDRSRD